MGPSGATIVPLTALTSTPYSTTPYLQELRDDIEHSIDFAVDAESRLISFTRSLVAAQI